MNIDIIVVHLHAQSRKNLFLPFSLLPCLSFREIFWKKGATAPLQTSSRIAASPRMIFAEAESCEELANREPGSGGAFINYYLSV